MAPAVTKASSAAPAPAADTLRAGVLDWVRRQRVGAAAMPVAAAPASMDALFYALSWRSEGFLKLHLYKVRLNKRREPGKAQP